MKDYQPFTKKVLNLALVAVGLGSRVGEKLVKESAKQHSLLWDRN
ncbi:hypothetical protein [uncultured Campylobacter sp.]|nr:hypothetical protein [uncultured Campylobacter sp.]